MHLTPPTLGPRVVVALAALALPLAAQTPVAPFTKGPRWEHATDAQAPAIARDVTFLAAGNLVAAGLAHGQPRLSLLGAQSEPSGAELSEDGVSWAGAEGVLAVDAVAGSCIAAAGITETGGERMRVARYTPTAQQAWSPAWTVDLASLGNGGNRLATRADLALVAQSVDAPLRVRLTALDVAQGALRWEVELAGGTLRALELSSGDGRALVLAGTELWVVETTGGQVIFHRHDDAAARSAALSGDGNTVVVGTGAKLEVLVDARDGKGYLPTATITGGAADYPVAVDLSADGGFLALGWWDGLTGRTVRLETWDLAVTPTRINYLAQVGPPFGPQNFVSEARVTADGRRAAFGLWGLGFGEPEVVLFDRDQAQPVLAESLAGSVYAIDLSADGTRLAAARKQGHANVLGSLGAVELLDTGERALELTSTAIGGGATEVWLAAPSGVDAALLIGTQAVRPLPVPGVLGLSQLDLSKPWALVPAQPAGPDRFVVPLSIAPAAAGLELVLQGLALTTGPSGPSAVLLEDAARPPIL
ncbi:WD40 repeat domain-containing protein [Engelhardtia mirabilis]|uniref:Uncharacterized protein n=1 Tax=Engelhardtia mirabilis TaxID=2528011 RepID=A0A518BNV5_9BACT|nr:hypothetical protein Pla133_37270 [Planctomycetes bacterium Pla133]QDV02953.1 hypothetical protein Pla86_37260 [Planctomycetes bacterium Pla86]